VLFLADLAKNFWKLAPPKEKKRSQDWSACKPWLIFSNFLKNFSFWEFVTSPWGILGIRLLIHQSEIRSYYEPKFHFQGRSGSMKVVPKVLISRRYRNNKDKSYNSLKTNPKQ
jgi:hypothetical protein